MSRAQKRRPGRKENPSYRGWGASRLCARERTEPGGCEGPTPASRGLREHEERTVRTREVARGPQRSCLRKRGAAVPPAGTRTRGPRWLRQSVRSVPSAAAFSRRPHFWPPATQNTRAPARTRSVTQRTVRRSARTAGTYMPLVRRRLCPRAGSGTYIAFVRRRGAQSEKRYRI
jgi:hypothetical protein